MRMRRGTRAAMALIGSVATVIAMSVVAAGGAGAAPSPTGSGAKGSAAHYTAAPCNTPQKQNYVQCFSEVFTALNHQIVTADQPPAGALGPTDIQGAYKLPAAGNGETVAIVDAFGDSSAESDLAQFRSYYGLPACTTANGCFQKVDQNGGTNYPPDDPGWGLETSLDLDAVSSACPNCHILLVEGTDNGLQNLGEAVDTAVGMGAKYVSNSYGVAGEDPSETQYDQYYTHPGVAVTASTGDAGNVTNWPATNPNVVGVGGTTLTRDTTTSRGWTESAWADGGSGCSPYEPLPSYQQGLNTDCPNNKAIADISADADPATGLAVYDTLGYGGWLQVGGTSLSSPLVASMYALAGTPVPGTNPASYPYADPSGLFDVTTGSNGGCGNVLCNAGPGWDGPTGLGTPDGVAALTTGPHGDIAGQVTDSSDGDPIAGATVAATGGYDTTTDSTGHYDMSVPVGTYDVTGSAFGYKAKTTTGVAVTDQQTTTVNFALATVPSHTLSGTVTDGSGHAWPVYTKITIDGYPNGAIYTNPFTGYYSVALPQGANYTLHASPVYPGYVTTDATVHVGANDVTKNLKVKVDQTTCTASGYAYKYAGTGTQFTGWTDKTAQDGWSIVDNEGNGQTWEFDNPGNRTPPPGGDADFAIVDSDHYGIGNTQDTSLVSPVVNLTAQTAPEIGFDTYYNEISNQTADVDLSLDGGQTWSNVWEQTTTTVSGHVDIPIPQAAGQADVQVRFHFTGNWGWWWAIDNVFIGTRTCAATHGGLVAGIVTDNNTGDPINGAKVVSDDNPSDVGISAATPDDANLSDGFYWLFSSLTGSHNFTASQGKYTAQTAGVNVANNFVTQQNFSLHAGHPTVSPGSVAVTEVLGNAKTAKLKFSNDGTEPVQVKLSEESGGFTPMGATKATPATGAPLQQIKGKFSTEAGVLQAKANPGAKVNSGTQLRTPTPYDPPWTDIANYPNPVMDNAVAYNDGTVYSVTGFNGSANVANAYAYDPGSQQWTAIADAPQGLESAAAAFVDGTLYLVGGWDSSGNNVNTAYAYDPSGNSWSQVANLPGTPAAAAAASLNGQLYVIGGCTTGFCSPTSSAVYRYDPSSNSWSTLANYPSPVAYAACAGIAGEIVCAGGVNADTNVASNATYIYDPSSDSWSQGANMPIDDWGMASSGANDMLQIAAGVTSQSAVVTNQAFQYDPSANSWSALPNANNAEYRGGGSCGMYKIGGSTGGFSPQPFAEELPGYDACGAVDVPWLSESTTQFSLAVGQTVTVTLTMDSSAVSQPGSYSAKVAVQTDSPYSVPPVQVTMNVNPPKTWGKIAGTVTDASSGNPISGATVQICTMYSTQTGLCGPVTYTLKTDSTGYYQVWLNKGFNPLQVIAAKDGYQPAAKIVKITAGGTTTTNFALNKS